MICSRESFPGLVVNEKIFSQKSLLGEVSRGPDDTQSYVVII